VLVVSGDQRRVKLGDGELEVAAGGGKDGDRVLVGLRPQDAQLSLRGPEAAEGVAVTVQYFEDLMEFGQATLDLTGGSSDVIVQTPAAETYATGDPARLTAPPERVYLFDPETSERIR
jgi:multiple sugar transport system ATP-binding protein